MGKAASTIRIAVQPSVSSSPASSLTIAEVAAETSTSVHTLRYYERVGLIRPVARASSGHRRYGADDVRWVTFLRRLHATGMPIRHMLEYAHLAWQGESTFTARRELLERHRDDVAAKISELETCLEHIKKKVAMYTDLERERARAGEASALQSKGRRRVSAST